MKLKHASLISLLPLTLSKYSTDQPTLNKAQFLKKAQARKVLVSKTLKVGKVKNFVSARSDRSRISAWNEERWDTDNVDKECLKKETCAYEEVLELTEKDEQQALKIYEKYARQCWVNRCVAQGTFLCLNKWNNRECKCKKGWQGDTCETDIDECSFSDESGNGINCLGEHKVCINSPGSFECACQQGYEMDSNDDCQDIDECADDQYCGDNTVCENSPGGFSCSCDIGYEETGSGGCQLVTTTTEKYNTTMNFTPQRNVAQTEPIITTQEPTDEPTPKPPTTTEKQCRPGYLLKNNQCIDMDECNEFCGLPSYDEVHCHEPVCGANHKCHNTDGSFYCESTCNDADCGPFSSCKGNGFCECDEHTLDTSKFSETHPTLNDKCISNLQEQIEWMNWFFENGGDTSARFIVGHGFACPKGFKAEPDYWAPEKVKCVDIDECEPNNGHGPCVAPQNGHSGCVNYFGGYSCVLDDEEENQMCHQYAVTPYKQKVIDDWSYPTCGCYPGYRLCEDNWTCTCACKKCARKQTMKKSRKFSFKKHNPLERYTKKGNQGVPEALAPKSIRKAGASGPTGISKCASNEKEIFLDSRGYKTGCYRVFDQEGDRRSYQDAQNYCSGIGGKLVTLTHRAEWWNVMRAVSEGWESFWISDNSLDQAPSSTNGEDGAQINVLDRLSKNWDGGWVANLPEDYRQVPPQWDIVDKRQKHRFVCEM